MGIDVTILTNDELDNLIGNHERKGAITASLYLQAVEERAGRRGNGLEFEKSRRIIVSAARERRFVSYKELADASGAVWSKVHYSIGAHLWELVKYSHGNGWPMLSAIVVNKPNVKTGEMEPETLSGFIAAARDLGYSVTDERAFLRRQQELVFEWAEHLAPEPRRSDS